MEKSADVAPHSAIRAFEQLWNTQYELDMDPKRVLKYKKEITTMAKRTVENHAIFAAYMTGDLTDPLVTARLNLCRKFARVGMYVFKTGPPFEYTRLPIDDEHVRLLEEADRASDNEFAEPRYRVSNDERSLVDLLEYMQRCLVFPSNATYNVSDTVSFRNKNVSWTEVTNRNFANEKRKNAAPAANIKPRRSVAIYVSDNRVPLPTLKAATQQTRIQVFC